jgi:hypothetical protein
MFRPKSLPLVLLLLATACSTTTAGTSSAPAAAGASAAAKTSETTTVTNTEVVCEYVRPSGSNIMVRECREVRRDGTDDPSKKGSENWFQKFPAGTTGR